MGDPNNLRDRLDALLKRAREISAEIERRVESVTGEAPSHVPDAPAEASAQVRPEAPQQGEAPAATTTQEALGVAAQAVAVSAEAAAVTAEALSAIASDAALTPAPAADVEPETAPVPTTVTPEVAVAAATGAPAAPASPSPPAPAAPGSAAPSPSSMGGDTPDDDSGSSKT